MSEKLKQARQSLGLTQLQMATLMGMQRHHYSDIERGANGRKPTRGHWACVRLIEHCHDAGIVGHVLASYNIILGWGTAGAIDDRGHLVWRDLAANGHRAHVLRLTSGGHPAHPLYLSYDCQPFWPRSLYGVDNVRPHASNKRSARYALYLRTMGL